MYDGVDPRWKSLTHVQGQMFPNAVAKMTVPLHQGASKFAEIGMVIVGSMGAPFIDDCVNHNRI